MRHFPLPRTAKSHQQKQSPNRAVSGSEKNNKKVLFSLDIKTGMYYYMLIIKKQRSNETEHKMSAKELIEVAKSKGLGVGRNRSRIYSYCYVRNGQHCEFIFEGTWNQFCKFIVHEVAPQVGSKIFNEIINS